MKFWDKPLNGLNDNQWEKLCDGCGLCCAHKFEDEDNGEILYTDVACRLLDGSTCRCTDYKNRRESVPECMDIRRFTAEQYAWLPQTCAYRLRFEGKPLFAWHPLISRDVETVHSAGISMRGQWIAEIYVADYELVEHIIEPLEAN